MLAHFSKPDVDVSKERYKKITHWTDQWRLRHYEAYIKYPGQVCTSQYTCVYISLPKRFTPLILDMSHGKHFTLYTHTRGPNGWYVTILFIRHF